MKTVFIWNVVLCTCMNEWIYSTDNFSNQALVDFKIQSLHTEKSAEKWLPKIDIHVPSDFRHFAYKQIASTWRTNHWFVRGKHHFIQITSTLTIVVFSISWSQMFALYVHQMCCKLKLMKLKTLNNRKMTASLRNHRKRRVCSDPCICTTQRYSFFSSEVLHEIWRIFPWSFDIVVISDVPTSYLIFCTKQTKKQSLFYRQHPERHVTFPECLHFFGRMACLCSETPKGVL